MKKTQFNQKFLAFAERVARDFRGQSLDIWFYAEIEVGMISLSVYQDFGDRVVFSPLRLALFDDIYALWLALPEAERWYAMAVFISHGRYFAQLTYPNQINRDAWSEDRREDALKAQFGDKPVEYPPFESGANLLH